MKCPECNSEMVRKTESHHYTESGLDDVYLKGIEICKCSCGEKIVNIPAMPELHSLLSLSLIKKTSLLNGKEIRFLRKNMDLTAKKLSKYIGVDNATLSRWETGNQAIDKSHDRLLRLIYSNIKHLSPEETRHLIEKDFEKIQPEQKAVPPHTIPVDEWLKTGYYNPT